MPGLLKRLQIRTLEREHFLEGDVRCTLQRHNTENSKQIFPEKELRGVSPNFHIHVSVSDSYIPRIGLPILLQENMWTDSVGIYINCSQT
jgi:hypothetical protein